MLDPSLAELLQKLTQAEAAVAAAQKAAYLRDSVLRSIYTYIEREHLRAKRALIEAADDTAKGEAAARAHEVSNIAGVLRMLLEQSESLSVSKGWVTPENARQIQAALLTCKQSDPPCPCSVQKGECLRLLSVLNECLGSST